MDRTQYGHVSGSNTYRPFDLARKEKPLPGYALLADLQNHIPKSAPPGVRQNAVYSNDHSVQKQTQPEVIYQNEAHYKQNGSVINGYACDKDMYKHEMREEIRTETHSSGPDINPSRPAVSSNLSELDSLLQDLNNAKKTGVFKDSSATTGTRPSVDALLNELNNVESSTNSYNHTSTSRTKTSAPIVKSASASNATRELDDLMANLSDFKREDIIIENNKKNLKKSIKNDDSSRTSWTEHYYGTCPPRPPAPTDTDVFVVPPPRPPPPQSAIPPDNTVLPTADRAPTTPASKTPSTLRVTHRRTEALLDESLSPSAYGGPVKRNDAEYRWITDQTKPEVIAVIDDPFEEPEIVKDPIEPIPFLQARVDTTYAKPQRPRTPTPEPPQTNQLDSMLGSLTSHMTEQGVTTTPKGCCNACDKPIVGSVITALGKPWHPEHFVCAHCQLELGTKNFFERDGKPYCEPDYHDLFSPKCAYCSSAILDKCVTALNKTWHPEHFFCAQCGNTFGEDGFHEKNGKPYCRECYFNLFAPKCGGCNSAIMENYISALNAQWHPECFVCRDCRQPFNGGSFFDHEGLPYCETHYHAKRGSLCYGCHKPITGRCITAMFRKYHPEHFVCAFCLQQLNKGTFKEQNDKPYCHGCFDKLFG